MKREPFSFVFLFFFLWNVFVPPISAAQEEEDNQPASTEELEENTQESVDAILLLDASGSMKVTDPERLRDEGAKLFYQFLKKGDRLAIVEFDKEARILRGLEDYSPIQALEIAQKISSTGTTGLYTNILAAVLQAKKLFEEGSRPDARQTVILLSDGKMDPDPASIPEGGNADLLTAALLYQVLPEMKAEGIVVHTLGFSDQADRELLKNIAELTGGLHLFSSSPEAIHEAFADLFLAVKKPQIVPMSAQGFRIDAEVQEATFYIDKEFADESKIRLRSPTGEDYVGEELPRGAKSFRGPKFEVITVYDPVPGIWQLEGLPSSEGFATVLTNMKLAIGWPTNVLAGKKYLIEAQLFDNRRPVVLPQMTGVSRFAFQITPTDKVSEPVVQRDLKDDGTAGDVEANDGVFSSEVELPDPGEYRLQVIAKTPTFDRTRDVRFRVKPRLVELELITVENKRPAASNDEISTSDFFRVTLSPQAAALKKVKTKLYASDSAKRKYELPLKQREGQSYEFEAPAKVLRAGDYKLHATIMGYDKKRNIVEGASQNLNYTRIIRNIDEGSEEDFVQVLVEEEKKVKEPEKPVSPVLWALIVALSNLGCGGFFFMKLKKTQTKMAFTVPKYEPSEELIEALATLEELAEQTEIDFEDPRLKDESILAAPASTPPVGSESPSDESEASEEEAGEKGDGDSVAPPEDGPEGGDDPHEDEPEEDEEEKQE